jgi:hypothetical protein
MDPNSLKAKQVNFTCDKALFDEIEEYCWKHRLRSRNHALRELIKRGLILLAKHPQHISAGRKPGG